VQWHWGNIGSAAGGLGALIVAVFAVVGIVRYGPAWLRDARARQQAQAEQATAAAELTREQARQITLERRRALHGWSRHGVDTFTVALVTSAEEMTRARDELLGGGPTGYVILRVAESQERHGDANRGKRLRQLADEGLISRPPTPGELDALAAGLDALGIPRAGY